ncbi:MAG: hypothetical protein MUC49_15075 [Raineya sp.]|jgi:hypothetical protein|nr:hypothetical protein [Raineya sp.]
MKIQPFILERKLSVFDDREPDDWYQKIVLLPENSLFDFCLAELISFDTLSQQLGSDIFDYLKVYYKNLYIPLKGSDSLSLHFYIRLDKVTLQNFLVIVSFGEFQPARYKVHLEGIWLLAGDR